MPNMEITVAIAILVACLSFFCGGVILGALLQEARIKKWMALNGADWERQSEFWTRDRDWIL